MESNPDPIPIIDCLGLAPNYFPGQLHQGLKSHGCVYLINTEISEKVIQNMFSKSRDFFQLPFPTKSLYSLKNRDAVNYGGYYVSTRQEFRQRYDFLVNTTLPEPHVPGFTETLKSYQYGMVALATYVLEEIGRSLFLPPGELIRHHSALTGDSGGECNKSHLSSIYYTGCGNEQIMDTHTDLATLTFLVASAPGYRNKAGLTTWMDGDPIQGGVLLHVGDMLERWSGGIYKATIHRVQGFGKESECRQSIPYFLHPDALVVVRPLVGDAEKYPPITAGDYWKLNLGRKMGL